MIDLYYWPTPNGHKITIFLEETGMPYQIKAINISKGQQHTPEFLKISPNGRMPAITDDDPADGGAPLSLFESGAILLYLAEKSGKLMPDDVRGRAEVVQWLFWQVGGLGPMAGQSGHFKRAAPEPLPYAIERYEKETSRLYGVMNRRLADRTYLAGENYSIADVASYPWVAGHEFLGFDLVTTPNLKRWFEAIKTRPATERAYAVGKSVNASPPAPRTARESDSST